VLREELGFRPCKADPDVWIRDATKPDGTQYYEYVLTYMDDIFATSLAPMTIIKGLEEFYTLKKGSVGEPQQYLGAQIRKFYIEGSDDPSKPRWAMSSETYVKGALRDVEHELDKAGMRLPSKASTPFTSGYHCEVDATSELDERRASYYHGQVGVLRWMVELGRIDIMVPVSMLASQIAAPRQGHLEQIFHLYAYLKQHERSTMVFDDTHPDIDESRFMQCDWHDFYPEAEEAVPTNAPEPRGNPVSIHCFVDADHGGCRLTRRLQTGVIIFLNRAPIVWHSKKQNTVESSTFGSEYVAMRTALELIEGLRYKLRMMGVPISGPANVYGDNEAVVNSTTAPESTLKKKHNAINYHRVREAVAAGTIRVAWEDTKTNISDLLTKLLPGPQLKDLIQRVLW
jgi:hypothetical protein